MIRLSGDDRVRLHQARERLVRVLTGTVTLRSSKNHRALDLDEGSVFRECLLLFILACVALSVAVVFSG